jgi:acetyl-CoA acetyltransferase
MTDDVRDFAARDRCAIVGIGQTEFSKNSGRTELSLAAKASLAAAADAGIDPTEIDGVVRCDVDSVRHNDIAAALGIPNLTYFGATGPGGVAPCSMVAQAVGAIVSGQARNVLVFRSLNGRSGRRFGQPDASQRARAVVGGDGTYNEMMFPYGVYLPGQMWAFIARRHMAEFGTTEEGFAAIAMAFRGYANANPRAIMANKPMTLEDYLASRWVARPLRLFDFCLESDGAAAVLITSAKRAKDCRSEAALIRSVALGTGPTVNAGQSLPLLLNGPTLTTLPSRAVADVLYKRAGLGPEDIDVAQIYDCFTISALVQLEDFGFCKKGEGGAFAQAGELALSGSLPTNTHGGNLSEAYVHGMTHILEGVRQLRGTSTSQVDGAETCLVTSSPIPQASAVILRKGA